jgi:hypothetical protein
MAAAILFQGTGKQKNRNCERLRQMESQPIFIETEVTEHLTDNSKKAIVGVISTQRAGKPENTVTIACFSCIEKC